jgi:hypothetical protein
MGVTLAHDLTHENIGSAPSGQLAGYCTGSSAVQWTVKDGLAHPGWIQIDQSPDNTLLDERADVIDYEYGAATLADLAPWYKAAMANFKAANRPGQREPLIYCSWSDRTAVCNALIAGGVPKAGLWIAWWDIGQAAATQMVTSASGPFPIRGVQYANHSAYDDDVFDTAWLNNVSGKVGPTVSVQVTTLPPGWWEPPILLIGRGSDGNLYITTLKADGRTWEPPLKLT